MLQADRSAESAGRLENLTELTRAMEEYESLPAFLEHVSLDPNNPDPHAHRIRGTILQLDSLTDADVSEVVDHVTAIHPGGRVEVVVPPGAAFA